MDELTREEICEFVEKSILDRQYNEELTFLLPTKTIKRVKEILHFDLSGYQGVISSHSVRHVKRGHPDDVIYIYEIIEIIQKFSEVKPNNKRDPKTGSNIVSLEFYKVYGNETVKLVKLKVHREKRLELKTLFVKD
jgi:hypothetical protein